MGHLRAAPATLGIGLITDLMQLLPCPGRLGYQAQGEPPSDDRRRHIAHSSRLANRGDHLLSIHHTNASHLRLASPSYPRYQGLCCAARHQFSDSAGRRQGNPGLTPPPPGRPASTKLRSCRQAVHVHRTNIGQGERTPSHLRNSLDTEMECWNCTLDIYYFIMQHWWRRAQWIPALAAAAGISAGWQGSPTVAQAICLALAVALVGVTEIKKISLMGPKHMYIDPSGSRRHVMASKLAQ